MKYTYRYFNEDSVLTFGRWLAFKDWNDLFATSGSNGKTQIYQNEMNAAMERFFPEITVRRKSTDPPWFNWKVRKRIKQKKGVYKSCLLYTSPSPRD